MCYFFNDVCEIFGELVFIVILVGISFGYEDLGVVVNWICVGWVLLVDFVFFKMVF